MDEHESDDETEVGSTTNHDESRLETEANKATKNADDDQDQG